MKRYKNAMKPSSLRFFIQDNNDVFGTPTTMFFKDNRDNRDNL